MTDASLFEETFSIADINQQKYDRVSRITGTGMSGDTSMTLDVNTEIYPISSGDQVHLLLASTLSNDGTKDESKGWRDVGKGEPSLADHYEYVCHGKIYRFEEGEGEIM
jgi:DNA-directed RNA polymerase I, II, and III subunit RPABC3